MANPFDQFDQQANPFDQFDDSTPKVDDVIGTKSAYQKYTQDYREKQTRPLIPGEQPPIGPPLSEKDWTDERNAEMAKTALSPLDAGLSFALKLPAMMAAGPAAVWSAVRGGDPEKTIAQVMAGPKWTDPISEAGTKTLNKFGEAMQPFGLAPYVHIGQVRARGGIAKPFAKEIRDAINSKKADPNVSASGTSFADIVAAEDAPIKEAIEDSSYKRYTHGIEQPNTDAQQIKLLEQEIAQQTIDQRQRALEQEVAQRQSLDFNAAERARQEAAPTGYEAWAEAQRQDIGGDPGNNAPINWPRKVADRSPEMTTSPMEPPYRYEGGIDPGINDARSLPIEIADALRTGDVPQDPFNRYSPQQAANRILREGEHPPIIKGRGPARGAIDARVFEDLYKFGKSVVRGEDGNLMPVYHGTTKEKQGFNPIRGLHETTKYEGNLGSWFSSTPKGTDTFSGARTGVSGGNVHQVYLNITNPKVFNTHQEFKQWFDSQPGSTNKIRRELIKQGYDGIEITLSNTDGGGIRTDFVAFHPEQIESAISPGTYKNKYAGRFNKQRGALFPKAKEGQTVTKILNLKGTPYDRITTKEQVLANPGKDLQPYGRAVIDQVQSGLEGTLRHNPNNAGVNFARSTFQEARNFAERLSKRYLTDNKTGLNAELNKLNTDEKVKVVGLMWELDRQQKPLTNSVMQRAGFSEQQKLVARRMVEANDALYANKNAELGALGYDAHNYRQGYMPGNFGGAYTTLVGYTDKDGKLHITGVAQADTKYGHEKALEWYRSQKDPKYAVEIKQGRSDLGKRTYASPYDGWADLIQAVAKVDPDFGKAVAMANQVSKDATASLYNFHLHEKAKKGIVGSYGNRPWLTAEQNTKEFLRSYIDYLEEGFKYTAYQNAINKVNELTTDPRYRNSHPNTVAYIEKYIRHITGTNLNPIGSAVNFAIDRVSSMVGLGNSQFLRANRELTQASTLHMMGIFNPGFFLAQLTQWATGGIPEAAQIRAALKQDPTVMLNSLTRTVSDITALSLEESLGRPIKNVPAHIREAWQWGHDNGLFTFSEVALAHQVLQSKLRRKVEPYLDWPIRLGEQATRPTVFLTFVDMFHNAGFRGEEAMLRAQTATDWAMANYHPDERPMLYQSLGALGNSLGALTTYKHNLGSQWGARAGEVVGPTARLGYNLATGKPKKALENVKELKDANKAALAYMIGIGFALYGVAGFPGYQEMSDMAEKLTGKPIREILLDDPKKPNAAMDGLLSWYTDTDFQSRLSMSSVLPDSPMSAFPHISNFFNIMDKSFEAGMNWDKGSSQELAKALSPAGTRGFVESQIYPRTNMVNDNGETVKGYVPLDKMGQEKYDTPRTPEQQMVRNILGTRPLRERLQDESVWSTRKSEAKRAEDMKKALERFNRAYLLGDDDGMAKAEEDYLKNDGDINTLYSGKRIQDVTERASKSEPDRRAGKPTSNTSTLKRYEEFTK